MSNGISSIVAQAAQGNMGVTMAMMSAQQQFTTAQLEEFLEKVPERGSKLWDRFKVFRDTNPNGDKLFPGFIRSIIEEQSPQS